MVKSHKELELPHSDGKMRELWEEGIASGSGKYKSMKEIIAAARLRLEQNESLSDS